ncbi:guanine nucleotide-binding protein G(I)/G(S)/G(O) subunit gamma-2 [Pimephales promelas]|nr:guanine nucleotide-binding protein G(I)/G(S)/G(O) subunit gamma-2 [Pimephales promelas]
MVYGKSALQEQSVAAETELLAAWDLLFSVHTQLALVLPPAVVSKASADLMHYCSEHAKYDPLLMGIPASENPFKDKKPCTIL